MSTAHRQVLLLTAVLLTALLAGCATVTQQALDQEGSAPPASTDPAPQEDSEPEGLTEAEARRSVATALASLSADEPDAEPPERWAFAFEVTTNGSESPAGEVSFLIDTTQDIVIMEMAGQAFQDEAQAPGGSGGFIESGSLVIAQVGKTTFFGGSDSVIAIYNESADPVESWDSLDDGSSLTGADEEDGDELTDPTAFLESLEDLPPTALVSYEETTYEGQPALQVEMSHENETSSIDLTMILLMESPLEGSEGPLPVRIEASFEDRQATDQAISSGHMLFEFSFGQSASHDLLEELTRAETMAITSADSLSGFGENEETRTWTIQPSSNPGLIPLTQVEVRLTGSESDDPLISLPAEDGSAISGNITLTYDDVDGDEAVSPGDRITLDAGNASSTVSVSLYDERTGMSVTPGPGLVGLLAALVLTGAALRRRP